MTRRSHEICIVMLQLQPKAQSRAKPAIKKPSQAGPFSRLQMAFGQLRVS